MKLIDFFIRQKKKFIGLAIVTGLVVLGFIKKRIITSIIIIIGLLVSGSLFSAKFLVKSNPPTSDIIQNLTPTPANTTNDTPTPTQPVTTSTKKKTTLTSPTSTNPTPTDSSTPPQDTPPPPPPPPPATDKIVVYGDTRTGHEIHQKIVDLIDSQDPEAVFHTGDLVNDGNLASDWTTFNNITTNLRNSTSFYPTLGNHEKESSLFYNNFTLPNNERWFAVVFDNIIFIVLNSNLSLAIGSEQYNWLAFLLQEVNDDGKFIAITTHYPPYSTGPHTEDELDLRTSVVPLFRQYGVDIVFNGHDHDYERSFADGIYYIVAGSGGAPLYDQSRTSPYSQLFLKKYNYTVLQITNSTLSLTAYDENNNQIDQISINK